MYSMSWEDLNKENIKKAKQIDESGRWNIKWIKAKGMVLFGDGHTITDMNKVKKSNYYQEGNLLSQDGKYIITIADGRDRWKNSVSERSQFELAVKNAGAKKTKFDYVDR